MKKYYSLCILILISAHALYAAPAAVTDLTVISNGFSYSRLSWSTPYDTVASTTPAYYELRLTTFAPVTSEAIWNTNSTLAIYPYKILIATGTISNTQKVTLVVTGLTNARNHYFAVKSSTDTASWSAIDTGTLEPIGYPVNTAPGIVVGHNLMGNTTNTATPTLAWTQPGAGSDDASFGDSIAGYYVELATSTDFSQKLTKDNIPSASWRTYVLNENTTYYWRVKAIDSEDLYSTSYAAQSGRKFIVNAVNDPPLAFNLISPLNSDILEGSGQPNFQWDTTTDTDPGNQTVTYTLFYSTNSNFNVYTTTQVANLASSPYQPAHNLIENATYYWKVNARDIAGAYRVSSTTGVVRINRLQSAPIAFDLQSPANAFKSSSSTVTFAWQPSNDPDPGDYIRYTVIYSSSDPSLATQYISSAGLSAHQYAVASLVEDTTYWWRVQAFDNHSIPAQSNQLWAFFINAVNSSPAPFALLTSSGIVRTLTPVFDWEDTSDPDDDSITYNVYYSEFSDFRVYGSSLNVSGSILPGGITLSDNTTYYWKVEAVDANNSKRVSAVWSMLIDASSDAPASFNLVSPASNETFTTFQIPLDWEDTSDPDPSDYIASYTVYYSTHASFLSSIVTTGITTSYYLLTLPSSFNGIKTYWKVKAVSALSGETTSSIRAFTVSNQSPGAFEYVRSSGVVESASLALVWQEATDPNGDTVTYTLYYSSMPSFAVSFSSAGLSAPMVSVSGLRENTTYFWYVNAADAHGNTRNQSAKIWSFHVNALQEAPQAFTLVSPADGVLIDTLLPAFDWETTTDPDAHDTVSYTLWYSSDSAFAYTSTVPSLTVSHHTLTTGLQFATTYYWKVIASGSDGTETESPRWSLVTLQGVRPLAPANVKAALSDDKKTVTLSWSEVTNNADGSALTNLHGYRIYASNSLNDLYTVTPVSTVPVGTVVWEGEKNATQEVYYMIKTVNVWGCESIPSAIMNVGTEKLSLSLPADLSIVVAYADVIIPSSSTIDIERISADEGGSILGSYVIRVLDANRRIVPITFDRAASIRFRKNSFAPAIKRAVDFGTQYVGVFWYNGVAWSYLGGSEDNGDIVIESPHTGAYQLRVVSRSSDFKALNMWPKIITPNGDGINDEFNITFENPASSSIEGNIYDINNTHIASMSSLSGAWYMWNGTNTHGARVNPGIYIYQLKVGSKVHNGTVVVAK